jgi:flagellar protein FliS
VNTLFWHSQCLPEINSKIFTLLKTILPLPALDIWPLDTKGNLIMTTEATQSYAKNSVLTEYQRDPEQEKALANNPEDTILLLLEGAIHKGALAIACHNSRGFTEKGFHLGRMTSIIDALRDRLDFKFNIAYDLETLYYYIDQCLQASVHETGTEQLEAAIQILNEIQEAWVISMQDAEKMTA